MPMIAALLAIAISAQKPGASDAVPLGVLPYGVAPELSAAVKKIAKLTQSGDFKGAKALLHLLPGREMKVQWDDAAVPESARIDYATARDAAISDWTQSVGMGDFKIVKASPDVLVKFVDDSTFNLKWSDNGPRLTVTIGLKQGGKALDPADMHNELSYAVGSYLGVAKLPLEGLIMHGQDALTATSVRTSSIETTIARMALTTALRIGEEVDRNHKLPAGAPALDGDLAARKLGPLMQGTRLPLDFKLKNAGDGTLVYQLIPDCNCFAAKRTPTAVAPGQDSVASVNMQTVDFSAMLHDGLVHKTLYLFSNDPTDPVRSIPVDVQLTPRYRILPPVQAFVIDKGVTIDAYLYAPTDHPLVITSAAVQGLPGEVTYAPWEGDMADPDMKEGAVHRKGYKLSLKLDDVPPGSQYAVPIVIGTDDPNFPTITYPVFVQKGIVALPGNLNMGEVGSARRKLRIHLIRPNQPFAITSIQTDSSHLAASYEQVKAYEYIVNVIYDGAGAKGDYQATVSIATDDPKQKLIQIPVTGTVR